MCSEQLTVDCFVWTAMGEVKSKTNASLKALDFFHNRESISCYEFWPGSLVDCDLYCPWFLCSNFWCISDLLSLSTACALDLKCNKNVCWKYKRTLYGNCLLATSTLNFFFFHVNNIVSKIKLNCLLHDKWFGSSLPKVSTKYEQLLWKRFHLQSH